MLDALVIAPHPDDAELGMGGSIALMLRAGMAVGILDLTDGEPTPRGSTEIRARETAAASAALGVTWRENLGLPNRRLRATLAARERLAGAIRLARPRWLFAPHWVDAHPDHVAATRLVEAARFWAASQFPPRGDGLGTLDRVATADAWWGSMIGTRHGEPFWSREPVALRNFSSLF